MLKSRIFWAVATTLLILWASYAAVGGQMLRLIDNLFMVGVILLMVAAVYTVISGGFFHLFSKGFRAFFPSRVEREYGGFTEPLDGSGEENRQQERSRQVKWLASISLITGLLLIALSYLLLLWR